MLVEVANGHDQAEGTGGLRVFSLPGVRLWDKLGFLMGMGIFLVLELSERYLCHENYISNVYDASTMKNRDCSL